MKPVALAALLVLAPTAALADEVHLHSGHRVRGIARIEIDRIVLETLDGEVVYLRNAVARVDTSVKSDLETYREMERDAEKATSAARFLQLAAWVREHGGVRYVPVNIRRAALFVTRANAAEAAETCAAMAASLPGMLRPVWERILSAQPDHERARRELGFVRHEGKWMTEDEFHAATGHVKFEGRWVTLGERDHLIRVRELGLEDERRALIRERELAESLRRSLEEARRDIEAKRLELARREAEVRATEELVRSLARCRDCGLRYQGEHLCAAQWRSCGDCGGRFIGRHECPRRLTACGACGVRHSGGHICAREWTYCGCCGGYFRNGHRCRK